MASPEEGISADSLSPSKPTPPTSTSQTAGRTDDLELFSSSGDKNDSKGSILRRLRPFSASLGCRKASRRPATVSPLDEEFETTDSASSEEDSDSSLFLSNDDDDDIDDDLLDDSPSTAPIVRGGHSLRPTPLRRSLAELSRISGRDRAPQTQKAPSPISVIVLSSGSSAPSSLASGRIRKRKRSPPPPSGDGGVSIVPNSKRRKLEVPSSGSVVVMGSNHVGKTRAHAGGLATAAAAGCDSDLLTFDLIKGRDLGLERSRQKFFEKRKKKKKTATTAVSESGLSKKSRQHHQQQQASQVSLSGGTKVQTQLKSFFSTKQLRLPPPPQPPLTSAVPAAVAAAVPAAAVPSAPALPEIIVISSGEEEESKGTPPAGRDRKAKSPESAGSLSPESGDSGSDFSEASLREVRFRLQFTQHGITDESNMTTITSDLVHSPTRDLKEKDSSPLSPLSSFIVGDGDVARLTEKVSASEPANYLSRGYDRTLLRRKKRLEKQYQRDGLLLDDEEDDSPTTMRRVSASRRSLQLRTSSSSSTGSGSSSSLVSPPRRRRRRKRIVPPEDMPETYRHFTALLQYIASCCLRPDFCDTVSSPADKYYFGSGIRSVFEKTAEKERQFLSRANPALRSEFVRDLHRMSERAVVEERAEADFMCAGCGRKSAGGHVGLRLSSPCVGDVRLFERINDDYRFFRCPENSPRASVPSATAATGSEVLVFHLDRPCLLNALALHRLHHFVRNAIRKISSRFADLVSGPTPHQPVLLLKSFISPECKMLKDLWLDWLVLLNKSVYRAGKPYNEGDELVLRNSLRKKFEKTQKPRNFDDLLKNSEDDSD